MTEQHLPELDDARVSAIERRVFDRIGDDRRRRSRRRRTAWVGAAAAAVIVVAAAAVSPVVISSLTPRTADSVVAEPFLAEPAPGTPATGQGRTVPAVPFEGTAADGSRRVAPDAATSTVGSAAREVTASASATVVVDDPAAAARAVAAEAQARGGYVESSSSSADGASVAEGGATGLIAPSFPSGDSITIRVAADQLQATVDALSGLGEVTSSSLFRQDVTTVMTDLRARIAAAETSVARLTQLIATAGSTADLIAAESALAERQATLDSDRQQLRLVEDQIALSSLTVQLLPRSTPVAADPAGFFDGLVVGWNSLLAALNGITVGFGFLLPWILVAGAATLVILGVIAIIRRVRSRRRQPPTAE